MREVKRGEKGWAVESETTLSGNLGKGRTGILLEEESSVCARRSGTIGGDALGLCEDDPGALLARCVSNFEAESD